MRQVKRKIVTISLLLLPLAALAQKPVATLPAGISGPLGGPYSGTVMDTTYSLPVGGRTWAAHNTTQFQAALAGSTPGDVIVLDAGVTYSGNFTLPAKSNPLNKWIYIISSNYSSLPAPGTRVSPSDAVNMPKISAPNATEVIAVVSQADHWRFVGIELTASSNYPSGCGTPTQHCMTYFIANLGYTTWPPPGLGDYIWFDRVYAHGSQYQDFQGAIEMNWYHGALMDSYVSDIHLTGTDANATGASFSSGPFKITNNFLEASSENIIFGGAGKGVFGNVPSDIEIQGNYLFKRLSWVADSVINNYMVVKNAFELKSAQRVLFNNNIIENVWANGQLGFAVTPTVRTGQSGDMAVVNDLTITNNILKNVVSGFNSLGADDTCDTPSYPTCTNAGSQDRWVIYNNLVTFWDPASLGGARNLLMGFQPGLNRPAGTTPPTLGWMRDVVLQHNTAIKNPNTPVPWGGVYFNNPTGNTPAPYVTENIWIVDNVLPAQTDGSNGNGIAGLNVEMPYPGLPDDLSVRYYGNEMAGNGGTLYTWPAGNLATNTAFTYDVNNIVTTPPWTTTSGPPAPPFQAGIIGVAAPPPTLVLTLPAYEPINSQITASYTGISQPAGYQWSFTQVPSIPGISIGALSQVSSNAATLHTQSPSASLVGLQLALGPYLVQVQAQDGSGNSLASAQAYTTFVPGNLNGVREYPNPWRSDRGYPQKITFDTLSVNTSIKIFTVSGHLVKTLPTSSTYTTWDLTNDSGDTVGSGIYLYLLTADGGQKATGKLVIIK